MTYLWSDGLEIVVVFDDLGTPLSFIWNDVEHQVVEIANRWRIDEEWWSERIWREYFKLTTTTKLLVIIYRDFLSGTWHLQRLYD